MRWILIVAVLAGCSDGNPPEEIKARAAELSSGFARQADRVELKQDETLLTTREIRSRVGDLLQAADDTKKRLESMEASLVKTEAVNAKEVIKSALEPQENPRANQSHPSIPVALSPAVRLYVSTTSNCQPCRKLKREVDDGEFSGFDVTYDSGFDGLRVYPAIRFETPVTSTGWGVVYGYDNNTIPTLRALTGAIKEQPITLIDRGTRSPVVRIKSTRRGLFGLFR